MTEIVIWAGRGANAKPLRDRLKAQGAQAYIVDAQEFTPRSVYAVDQIVFVGAPNSIEIEAAYRAAGFAGTVVSVGPDGEIVEVQAPSAIAADVAAQPDFLTERLAAMNDEALRTYVRGVTGVDPGEEATREAMEAMLRGDDASRDKDDDAPQTKTAEETAAAEVGAKRGRKGKAAQEG